MTKSQLRACTETGLVVLAILSARVVLAQEPPRTVRPSITPLTPTAPVAPSGTPFRTPDGGAGPVPTPPMAPPTPKPDDRIAIQLKDGSRILGKLSGLEKLKAKSTFGEVAIPVDAILGLRMADNGPSGSLGANSTILFRNGDVLTAEPVLGTLKVETSWGEVTIPGKHVESIVMTTERIVWINDGRWRLAPEGTGPSGMMGTPMRSPYPAATYATPAYSLPYTPGPTSYLPPSSDLAPPAFPPTIPSPTSPPTP
jgi:hypothetical protein